MLVALLTALYVLVCFVLLLVVLLQQGKGGDIAAAFGGSSSQAAFGARAGATLLTHVTTVSAVVAARARGVRQRRRPAAGLPERSSQAGPGAVDTRIAGSGRAGDRAVLDAVVAGPDSTGFAIAGGTGADEAAGQVTRSSPAIVARRRAAAGCLRKWRNWQTHQLEGLAPERAWGFESPLPHQYSTLRRSVT